MAENKTFTEVQALEAAKAYIPETETALVAKLDKMIETRNKPRTRKKDDSKRLANVALGEQFMEIWPAEEPFKASDVKDALNLDTSSKASQVCRAMGWEIVPSTERVRVYRF